MPKKIPHISEVLTPARWDRYMGSPAEFTEDMIFNKRAKIYGGDFAITDQQLQVLDSIVDNRRVTVRAGRGIGKTALLSWLTIWWLSMFSRGRVVCTAPSFPQLQSVLWPEVSKWLKDSLLADYFVWTNKRLYLAEDRENTFAEPRTASKEESAQGLHGEHLLVMMDEASGIEDRIYEVLEGSFTNKNNKIILMTNPTKTSGFAYDSHNRNKRFWKTFKFSSEDSPNIDKDWLEAFRDKYVTPNHIHDMYKVHVLGEFPSGDPEAFIGLEAVQAAVYRGTEVDEFGKKRSAEKLKEGPVEIGVDVARMGDDSTVICVRQGMYVYSAQELGLMKQEGDKETLYSRGQTKGPDVLEMVYETIDAVRRLTGYTDTIRVKVDDTGLGGMGVVDYLELDREHNIEVIPCLFGAGADENYADKATIMWGNVKEHIDKMHIPNDRALIEELSTRRHAEPDKSHRPRIEPKSRYKRDFNGSPDRADALVLCFADLQNERRFVKGFDPASDNAIMYESEKLRSGANYCALFCSPSHKMSAIFCTWFGGKLRIYDEYEGDNTDIINVIRELGPFSKVIGSNLMFKYGTDDLSTQYAVNGVFVFEQFGYEEVGAINHMAKIAEKDKLIVAKECRETNRQLRMWTTNKGKSELKENYGLCYAISYVVSELITSKEIVISTSIPSYQPLISSESGRDDPNIGFMSM